MPQTPSGRFAHEEVRSIYMYPKEYGGPKPINDQIKATATIFSLDPTQALEYATNLPALPEGAEGWFAVPSADALAAKHFPEVTDPAEKYCRAVHLVHTKIAETRAFHSYHDGQITPVQLRVSARTAHAIKLIAEKQSGDILIIAAQLGVRHSGCSIRRAREVFQANEFGLTSLAVGSIVLTHPERLICWEELDMDCSGDEFGNPRGDYPSPLAPIFFFDGGTKFGMARLDHAHGRCGSVSAFLPD